tara:strand:- start:1376 stop:1591 length:216 start_codon:yes stop_codon:yes gene_type:complete
MEYGDRIIDLMFIFIVIGFGLIGLMIIHIIVTLDGIVGIDHGIITIGIDHIDLGIGVIIGIKDLILIQVTT